MPSQQGAVALLAQDDLLHECLLRLEKGYYQSAARMSSRLVASPLRVLPRTAKKSEKPLASCCRPWLALFRQRVLAVRRLASAP
jgi:hypothetical protein